MSFLWFTLFFNQVIVSFLLLWLPSDTWVFFAHVSVCLSFSLVLSVCLTGCCFWLEIFTVVLFIQELTYFLLNFLKNCPLCSYSLLLYIIFDHDLSFFLFNLLSNNQPSSSSLSSLSPTACSAKLLQPCALVKWSWIKDLRAPWSSHPHCWAPRNVLPKSSWAGTAVG